MSSSRKRKAQCGRAFRNALYYSEISVRNVSPRVAHEAVDQAQRRSRWWMNGLSPRHPALGGSSAMDTDAQRSTMEAADAPGGSRRPAQMPQMVAPHQLAPTPYQSVRDDDIDFSSVNPFDKALPPWMSNTQANQVEALKFKDSNSSSPASRSAFDLDFVKAEKNQVASCEELLTSIESFGQNRPPITMPEPATIQVISESEDGSNDESTVSSNQGRREDTPSASTKKPRAPRLDVKISKAKTELLSKLNKGEGFNRAVAALELYSRLQDKNRKTNKEKKIKTPSYDMGGTWQMISPPDYPTSLGKNAVGEQKFTLGRATFDMYEPKNLVITIQGQYNTIQPVGRDELPCYVPKSLRREVDDERTSTSESRLKTHNIIAAFTIQGQSEGGSLGDSQGINPARPIRGVMVNYGYSLPDPDRPRARSIWFTGGTLEPADESDLEEWKRIFRGASRRHQGSDSSPAEPDDGAADEETARTLASRILLGAVSEPMDEETGVVGYHLLKPIGGHGSAYCDTLYLDNELKIMRGHAGSVYVFKRAKP